MKIAKVLSIAGSDCSGGAGIQADLKTFLANGVYGMSVITALTAQNTMGVTGVSEVSPAFLEQQLDAVFADIYPDAVKTGMVASIALIQTISKLLKKYQAKNIVVDPVMVATSGSRLISEEAIFTLEKELLPLARVITPNIMEAEVLTGYRIRDMAGMKDAAKRMYERFGCATLCKGGHSVEDASDVLFDGISIHVFEGERIENPNTHGTGCTLSSAIAAGLAKGLDLREAIWAAKEYITGALRANLNLGQGSGPLHHGYRIDVKEKLGQC